MLGSSSGEAGAKGRERQVTGAGGEAGKDHGGILPTLHVSAPFEQF